MTSAAPCDWLGPVIYDMNYDNHDVSVKVLVSDWDLLGREEKSHFIY